MQCSRQLNTTMVSLLLALQVLASSKEALAAAQQEASIQQSLGNAPCILPLIDWAVVAPPVSPTAGSSSAQPHTTVYLLSPAYLDGTLHDELARLGSAKAHVMQAEGRPLNDGGPPGCQGVLGTLLPTRQVRLVWFTAYAASHLAKLVSPP